MLGLKKFKAKVDVAKEMQRRKSQRQKILELLQGDDLVYTHDLQRIAFNYTMRISELRKDGHKISSEYVKSGVYLYIYGGKSED